MSAPRPTPAELSILRVLWGRGPCTVREVLEDLERDEEVGYTTVLKQLQIMAGKGLVARDTAQRTHTYRAAIPEEETQRGLVADLVQRAFGGSALALVQRALAGGVSDEERDAIRKLLDGAPR